MEKWKFFEIFYEKIEKIRKKSEKQRMGLIDVAFMINERSEANCNGKKRDRIDGHEQIDTLQLAKPRTSLDMDGTLNLDCYSLGRVLYLNCLQIVEEEKRHGVHSTFHYT